MNLVLIEQKRKKVEALRRFQRHLRSSMGLLGKLTIGYPGGNETRSLYVSGDFWFAHKNSANKGWNAFGFIQKGASQHPITVEINIARGSNTRRIAGFFAKDLDTGQIYVLHSGDVGGGGKGIGKIAFLAWSKEELVSVSASGRNGRPGILIAPINRQNTVSRLEAFARKVREFKLDAKSGRLNNLAFQDQVRRISSYTKEFSGRKSSNRKAALDYVTYHGDVVEALNDEATANGFKTQNKPEDLLLRRGRRITRIYEVKTSADRQSI